MEVGERQSLLVSFENAAARALEEKAPGRAWNLALTPGPVTAAGCWETQKHLFQHRSHARPVSTCSGAREASACSSSGRTDRLGHREGTEPLPRPWAATGPCRPAPPRASRNPVEPGAWGEHVLESEPALRLGPPISPGAQSRVGRTQPSSPRALHSQHRVRPTCVRLHFPWLNVEGKRE